MRTRSTSLSLLLPVLLLACKGGGAKPPQPPTSLTYTDSAPVYSVGQAITPNTPSSGGGAVASYAITPALPAGLSLSTSTGIISGTPTARSAVATYTVTATNGGGSTTADLTISVIDPPASLAYSSKPAYYTKGVAIAPNTPSSSGGAVVSYDVTPALPAGLSLDVSTGIVSGTPTVLSTMSTYVVTATNADGSAQAWLSIAVSDVPPAALTYSANPAAYPVRVAIAPNTPSSGGGPVTSYTVSPALPAALKLNPTTGVITGIPTAITGTASYVVTASNSGGSTQATLDISVIDAPPWALAYSANPAIYTQGVVIAANVPRTSGGAPTSYSVNPPLPAGLSLSATTGVVSGTPTAVSTTASYTVTASNGLGSTTASLTLTVVAAGTANGGGLDPAFGGGTGFVTHDSAAGGHGSDVGNAMVRDAAGRLVVTGYSVEAGARGPFDMALWRYGADGTLDTTFNGTGFLTDPGVSWNGNAQTIGMGVAIDSRGRIVVAGYSLTDVAAGVWMMVVWRFNPDGTRDTTFNGVGFANYPLGQMQSAGTAVAIDSSDRIVVSGFAWNGTSWDMAVARYGADGFLDTTFNGTGYAVQNGAAGGNGEDIANDVAIDGAGRIVLTGGSANTAGNTCLAIWRYKPDGTLDTTFNGSGVVTRDHDGGLHGYDGGHTVTFDPTGHIVVTGWSPNAAGNDDFALWRYNADGTIDTTFNGVGYLTQNGAAGGSGLDEGFGVVVDGSGRIVATGTSTNAAGDTDMVVWRYQANGTLDASFGGQGFVVYAGTGGGINLKDGGRAVLIDGSGRLVIAGYSGNAAGDVDLAIWRLLP